MVNIFKKHGKTIIRSVGIAGVIVAAYLIISGIACLASDSTVRDDSDCYKTWDMNMQRESHALVFISDGKWVASEMSYIRIQVEHSEGAGDLFIGIASKTDVSDFLDGVYHDEIRDIDFFPSIVHYNSVMGDHLPGMPDEQEFWISNSSGEGIRQLKWDLKKGESLVIMNSDGTKGIDIEISIWTPEAFRFFLGAFGVGGGGVIMILSLFAVLFAKRNPVGVYGLPKGMLPEK